jgi:hypothetical protein
VAAAGAQIAVTVPVVGLVPSAKFAAHCVLPIGYESSTNPPSVSPMLAPPPITTVPVGQDAVARTPAGTPEVKTLIVDDA